VVIGVSLAFAGAESTLLPAGGHLRPRKSGDELRLAAEEASGCHADVGAVDAPSDAGAEFDDIVLRQRRIGAGGAALHAGQTLIDAPGEEVTIELGGPGMRLQQLLRQRRCGHRTPFGLENPDDRSLDPTTRQVANVIAGDAVQQTSGRSTSSRTVVPGLTSESADGEVVQTSQSEGISTPKMPPPSTVELKPS
jgi:hypothetical protein